MRHDLIVSKSIDINASPEKIWDVMTNPEIIKEYLFGTQTLTDWKVGSEVLFQGEYQGQTYSDKGIILKNEPLKLLSYSYWSAFTGTEDKPENYSQVSYKLHTKDNHITELTWEQKGFTNEEGYNHSQGGMDAFMQQIKGIAER